MTKYVADKSAAKAISAYVILNRKGEFVAKVQAHFGNSRVTVNVFDDKAGFQRATASGYGYDKFSAALSGLTIDGHKMSERCGERVKPPRGKPCFPANYKPRKGYQVANYGQWERVADKWERRDSYYWRDLAISQWRAANGKTESDWPEGEDCEQVQRDARRMAREAEESGRVISGYSDCYREAGLQYLKAIGYRVIQAI